LRPAFPATEAGRLTILASVAASDAVENVAGVRPRIKWPNDLQIGGKKLGGLLIESEPRGTRLDHAVIGIGINVRHEADDFSGEVGALATSLRIATGKLFRRADVLVALLHAFGDRRARPFAETREAWANSSLTLGQRVELSTARGLRRGQAIGLDEGGALLLRNEAGEIETVTAGDMRAV
jgi:BirA family biotin operon repressor/biotin-[acetyl-CoA-carboxylase] ligase